MTRAALVSVSPSPPTCVVSKNIGAPGPSWKSWRMQVHVSNKEDMADSMTQSSRREPSQSFPDQKPLLCHQCARTCSPLIIWLPVKTSQQLKMLS